MQRWCNEKEKDLMQWFKILPFTRLPAVFYFILLYFDVYFHTRYHGVTQPIILLA